MAKTKIKVSELYKLVDTNLKNLGYDAEESKVISDVLIFSDLRNINQGCVKLESLQMNKDPEGQSMVIENETATTATINGRKTVGMLVLDRATKIAIEKAKKNGLAMVTTYNTYTSTGALSYYTNLAADQGLIGIVSAGSSEFVAPFGSYQPIFGTNPLAFATPTSTTPLSLDFATAAIAWFGVMMAKLAGQELPPNVCYDANGNVTLDPSEALNGAALVFDKGHKGSALALMVEILTGCLSHAAIENKKTARSWGNMVIVIDPSRFLPLEEYKARVSTVCNRIKTAKPLPGVTQIFLPGEREAILVKERLEKDELEMNTNTVEFLKTH